jgi:hypothetical protein
MRSLNHTHLHRRDSRLVFRDETATSDEIREGRGLVQESARANRAVRGPAPGGVRSIFAPAPNRIVGSVDVRTIEEMRWRTWVSVSTRF